MTKIIRDVSGLLKSAKEKNEKTTLQVKKTFKKMLKEKQKITFSSVAKQAQVSRSWLYQNTLIRDKIKATRQQQSSKIAPDATVRSQQNEEERVKTFKKQIKKLQQENAKLHRKLEAVYGEMVEK